MFLCFAEEKRQCPTPEGVSDDHRSAGFGNGNLSRGLHLPDQGGRQEEEREEHETVTRGVQFSDLAANAGI